jgi:hypothetical protein
LKPVSLQQKFSIFSGPFTPDRNDSFLVQVAIKKCENFQKPRTASQKLIGCHAAFASKLCSYKKQKQDQKIAACGSSYTG